MWWRIKCGGASLLAPESDDTSSPESVTIRSVRTISREDPNFGSPQRLHAELHTSVVARIYSRVGVDDDIVRASQRCEEIHRNDESARRHKNTPVVTKLSEIPCRVSSDLHEWRNDLGTVSMGGSAKLQYG